MKLNMTSILPTLVNFMVIFSLGIPVKVHAETTIKSEAAEACADKTGDAKVKCMLEYNKMNSSTSLEGDPCGKAARDSYREAKRKIGEACGAAGFGANCYEEVMSCEDSLGSQDFNTMGVLGQVTGMPLDSLNSSSQCPQLSGKDYFSTKKEIEADIKDANNDLADLEKEKADIEKDFNTEMQDIQKEIREAQKELADEKLKINEDSRQQKADFAKQQAETRNEVRKKNMDMLQLRGKMIKSDRDKATKMLQLSEGSTKRACMSAVKKLRDDLLKPGSKISIKDATALKAEINSSFDDCMKNFDQQRAALNETYRQEQSELQTSIDQLQSDIDDMENQLKLASSQLSEMEADAKSKQSTAEQNLVKMMQEAQTKMQASQQNMQKRLTAMSTKQGTIKQRLFKLNNELMALGPVPADRGSEDSPRKAMGKISAETEVIQEFEATCMPDKGKRKTKTPGSKGAK